MKTISRRKALLGATAAVAVAGVPAATNAANLGNPDALLFALVEELERVERKRMEIRTAEAMERKAIRSRLPMPPDSIRFSEERSIMGRDGVSRWITVSASFIEKTRAAWIRERPERSKQINKSFDRILEELHAYEAECERLRNNPRVRALRARSEETAARFEELVDEINTMPAHTVAGVLRKMQAADAWWDFTNAKRNAKFPSFKAPACIASAMRDLERLAGEARS